MPFGNIIAQTIVYEPRNPGVYSRAGVTYEQPLNEFRIRGAKPSGTSRTANISRVVQKDITVGSGTERRQMTVSLNITTPAAGGFTPAELDSAVADLSEFVTASTISRVMQDES